jgi:chemotaxis response regulator CheB
MVIHVPITSTFEFTQSTTVEPIVKAKKVKDFPIVCVGGSVGGFDVFIRLLQNLSEDIA